MRQPSYFLKVVVGPALELGERVIGEKLRRTALIGDLPRRSLGAVLAELEGSGTIELGVGAADASKAVRLVLLPECQRTLERNGLADQFRFGRETNGTPAAPWGWEDLDLWLVLGPRGP